MSEYDYAGSYGKPVSVVSYGRGTRTYVTRVEERVEQVRRPSAMGYAYYSAMKAEKEGRPREVDNLITKILDEVNGSTVSTTTRSSEPVRDLYGLPAKVNPTKDYGVGYNKFGDDSPAKVDGRRGYYVEYTYVGSGNHGDPYDQQDWSRHLSSNPPQNDYGVPNQSGSSRVKSETSRDYQPPKNRWETSSHPISDVLPYNPPHLEYHSSKSYGARPGSPRDHGVPNNQLKSEMAKDYEAPYNQWNDSPVKPMSPKAYEGSGDRWNRPSDDQRSRPLTPMSLDIHGDYTPVKPYSSDGYGIIDNENGRSASPRYDNPPKTEIIGGSPNNRWGNSGSKPIYETRPYEDNIGDRDRYLGNSSLKPQSPKNYGVSDNPNYGQQTSPWMKPQSPKAGSSPSPEYEHPPRNNLVGGVASDRWANSPLKTQSPRDYGTRDNQWDRPSSPVANKGDGTPHGREVKLGSPRGYEVPNDRKERSKSPEYEHPPRNDIGGIPSSRWGNTPLKTQSPLDYRARDNQWGKPSSSVASKNDGTPDDQQAKLGSSKGYNEVPKDQKGRSTSPGYEHPPRNEIISPAPSNGWGNPSLKVRIPQDDAGRTNRGSSDPNSPQTLKNGVGVANNGWSNALVRTQSPRDHGSPVNQLGNPSSPVYNGYNDQKNVQPNVATRDGVPSSGNKQNVTNNTYDPERKGDYGGSTTMKPSSGYQSSPLSQATSPLGRVSDKTGNSSGKQRVLGGESSQPKYSIYSAPVSQVVTVRPGVVDSMEAQRRSGNLGASTRSYIEDEEHGKPIITCRDAIKKYNGSFF